MSYHLKLLIKIDFRRVETCVQLSNLSIYCKWKDNELISGRIVLYQIFMIILSI